MTTTMLGGIEGFHNNQWVYIRFTSETTADVFLMPCDGRKHVERINIPQTEYNADKGLKFVCKYLDGGILSNTHFS